MADRDTGLDAKYARLIATECDGPDVTVNGSRLDGLLVELLREINMTETLAAWRALEVWR